MVRMWAGPSGRVTRLGMGAIVAVMMAGLTVVPTVRTGHTEVGELSTSMVEMLGTDQGTGVVSLSALRADVLGDTGLLTRTGAMLSTSRTIADVADGTGIDVALIDTGVSPVDGLDGKGKVLHGPDLSMEASAPEVAFLDTYGHGTHMAGVIAGTREGDVGIAPGARIVSVKVAGHDGVTTVPQVVAAIDWVVEHRNTDGMNIRVLNLSLGQQGVTSHVGDPLSAAVERAWRSGIVVVVAAGNDGETQPHLDSPAIDPYVMAVGAVDSRGQEARISRPVPTWSAYGDGERDPDVVAQGRSIASYRVPGSTIDEKYPDARIDQDLFRGSGTSQSAAVTSGVAAVMLSRYPNLTPDQVKFVLEYGAIDLEKESSRHEGEGHLNGDATVWAKASGSEPQEFRPAAGEGTGILAPSGATWSGGTWSGATWSGATWSGATWSGGTWSGATWSGATWSGATWSGATWSGATWSGATWSGATWSGATWSGATWSGNGWS